MGVWSYVGIRCATLLVLFVLLQCYLVGGHSSIETIAVERTNILINTTVRDEQLLGRYCELILKDDLMVMMWVIVAAGQCVSMEFFRLVVDASSPRKAVRFEYVAIFVTMVVNLLDVSS